MNFDVDRLIGLSEGDAVLLAGHYNHITRVVNRNGTPYIVTMDYRTDRINLTIVNSIVTGVRIG